MEWILIAGALCLSSHHDICIKHSGEMAKPYVLSTPLRAPQTLEYLGDAKAIGQGEAHDLDEFPLSSGFIGDPSTVMGTPFSSYPGPTIICKNGTLAPYESECHPALAADGGPVIGIAPNYYSAPAPVQLTGEAMVKSAPYGMTKAEFGAFIEDHVYKAFSGWFTHGVCPK